jgi:hypothetical protein
MADTQGGINRETDDNAGSVSVAGPYVHSDFWNARHPPSLRPDAAQDVASPGAAPPRCRRAGGRNPMPLQLTPSVCVGCDK